MVYFYNNCDIIELTTTNKTGGQEKKIKKNKKTVDIQEQLKLQLKHNNKSTGNTHN